MISLLEIKFVRLAEILYWIAGAAIVAMMALTCIDVFLRYAVTLNQTVEWAFLSGFKPMPGTFELVGFLGVVAASFAMAHTAVKKGHVAVSFAVQLLPIRYQKIVGGITDSFGLFFFTIIAWRAFLYGMDLQESGEVSPTLQFPFYLCVYGIGIAAIAVCLILFVDLVKNMQKAGDR
ncbi:MAG: TRAP transporter small permease [Desulfatirhabdiaceae bacterium]